nr:uncharacterized protein LOC124809589 [Hydra vulgaris]
MLPPSKKKKSNLSGRVGIANDPQKAINQLCFEHFYRSVKCRNQPDCKITQFACLCEVNKKVPLLDREYLKDQKLKIGTIGRFQIGTIDKKAVAIEKRKRDREVNQQIKSANSLAPEIQCDHYMDCDLDNKNDSETDPDYSITAPAERNQTYLTNMAKAAIRYEISDVATADPVVVAAIKEEYHLTFTAES